MTQTHTQQARIEALEKALRKAIDFLTDDNQCVYCDCDYDETGGMYHEDECLVMELDEALVEAHDAKP